MDTSLPGRIKPQKPDFSNDSVKESWPTDWNQHGLLLAKERNLGLFVKDFKPIVTNIVKKRAVSTHFHSEVG